MERIQLGRTGIEVTRVCLGCWQASKSHASFDEQRMIRTVQHAVDRGINFLDTASLYEGSEKLLGRALEGRRNRVVIATKSLAFDPSDIRKNVENSLRALKTDRLDLLQQHWPTPNVRPKIALKELEALKREGKIRAIGVSNWMELEWSEIDDPSRVETLQPCYSLLWRSIEPSVLPLCRKYRIAVLPYSPLCQGVLAGKIRTAGDVPPDIRRRNPRLQADVLPETLEIVGAVEEVAAKHGKKMSQVALRWLLDQEGVTSVIAGASTPEQVDENLGALDWKLDSVDWKRLSDLSWPLSESLKPYDSLFGWHPMTG